MFYTSILIMTSAPRHTHDTLVEALCEFRLAPSTTPGWTAKSPGQLFNQLQAEFPNMEPVNKTGIEFTVDQKTRPVQIDLPASIVQAETMQKSILF